MPILNGPNEGDDEYKTSLPQSGLCISLSALNRNSILGQGLVNKERYSRVPLSIVLIPHILTTYSSTLLSYMCHLPRALLQVG